VRVGYIRVSSPQPRRPSQHRPDADRQERASRVRQGELHLHRRGLADGRAFAEFERDLILERQREGIAAAKARGAYTGRKPALTAEQARQLRERAAAGERKSAPATEFGISRDTMYGYLRAQPATA
jgi:hypothetical protein